MYTLLDKVITNKTFADVKNEISDWRHLHQPFDRVDNLSLLVFNPFVESKHGQLVKVNNQADSLMLMPHAFNQLMSLLRYDKELYGRLPDKLNFANVNWLIQNSDVLKRKGVLLRCQDLNQIRAILSDRYEDFDNEELLNMVEPYCSNAEVKWSYSDDEVFHLSLTFPGTLTEVQPGDEVMQGLHISNSEVGMRSVTIASYVWRLRCSNGMVSRGDDGMFRFRHMGDSDRIRELVRSAIETAYAKSTGIVERFKQALQVKVDNVPDYMENIVKNNKLSGDEFKIMLDTWGQEPGNTLFHVSNAISSMAHRTDNGEKAYEYMQLAERVL